MISRMKCAWEMFEEVAYNIGLIVQNCLMQRRGSLLVSAVRKLLVLNEPSNNVEFALSDTFVDFFDSCLYYGNVSQKSRHLGNSERKESELQGLTLHAQLKIDTMISDAKMLLPSLNPSRDHEQLSVQRF